MGDFSYTYDYFMDAVSVNLLLWAFSGSMISIVQLKFIEKEYGKNKRTNNLELRRDTRT
jgi:hypothetical protein